MTTPAITNTQTLLDTMLAKTPKRSLISNPNNIYDSSDDDVYLNAIRITRYEHGNSFLEIHEYICIAMTDKNHEKWENQLKAISPIEFVDLPIYDETLFSFIDGYEPSDDFEINGSDDVIMFLSEPQDELEAYEQNKKFIFNFLHTTTLARWATKIQVDLSSLYEAIKTKQCY